MPQLSLYIDDMTLARVNAAAQAQGTSVSKLVRGLLARDLADTWPPEFLATLGAITDPSFERPAELDLTLDRPRADL
ncbi:MAG: ribbon-helix-helix protein, CopG family [Propionibacteriaceae bacterium]|jgi:hypothetical protein|nr:ribbon-helix-helix protein, CopG family [Propionibacteriaceae bacterium]